MSKMKYVEEYFSTKTKQEFIKLLYNKYKTKKVTAERRFYDVRKKYGKQNGKYTVSEKIKPNFMKMLMVRDMNDKKFTITRILLEKHGFSVLEINWLEDEGWLK